MRLDTKESQLAPEELEKYYRAIKMLFKQPRKTLLNNLTGGGMSKEEAEAIMASFKMPKNIRAQDLSVTQIQKIANLTSSPKALMSQP